MTTCSHADPEIVRRSLDLTVLHHTPVCHEHHRLTLHYPHVLAARAGQFLQLRCRRTRPADPSTTHSPPTGTTHICVPGNEHVDSPVVLPRPFSIADLRTAGTHTEIDIIYRVVGRGTTWMTSLQPSEHVTALGPLGNGFTVPSGARPRAYLVGGGCGLPPMIWLAKTLQAAGCRTTVFCGARTANLLPLTLTGEPSTDPAEPKQIVEEFSACQTPAVITTDDGTLGVPGRVGDAMEAYHAAHPPGSDSVIVYTCGPEAMMRAVAAWCIERKIPCQVCMERMMACGIGTCQSCVVPIRSDTSPRGFIYKLCCKDGPVFDARDVLWNP